MRPDGAIRLSQFCRHLIVVFAFSLTLSLSHCLTVSLSHSLTVSLSHCLTVSLSHMLRLSLPDMDIGQFRRHKRSSSRSFFSMVITIAVICALIIAFWEMFNDRVMPSS